MQTSSVVVSLENNIINQLFKCFNAKLLFILNRLDRHGALK
jgi:hypothetical protein